MIALPLELIHPAGLDALQQSLPASIILQTFAPEAPKPPLYLRWDGQQLALCSEEAGCTQVNFGAGKLRFRCQHRVKEPLYRALGLKGQLHPEADFRMLDATAGMGRDAYLIASWGVRVAMLERSPWVAALLTDGLRRLKQEIPNFPLELHWGNGCCPDLEQLVAQIQPQAIYLDPMYPHRKKSSLVKKEMRILRQAVGEDPDSDKLLRQALALNVPRVVVKRPSSAAALADIPPHHVVQSENTRFDVYCHHR